MLLSASLCIEDEFKQLFFQQYYNLA